MAQKFLPEDRKFSDYEGDLAYTYRSVTSFLAT